MPRPNPPRTVQGEINLARRIAYERERRSWTYEGIARRLTEVGCPIQGSAIYKIEKGQPRRRISVDEFVAFAEIFEIERDELLIPLELRAEHEALDLITELERKSQALSVSAEEYYEAVERLHLLMDALDDESRKAVLSTFWSQIVALIAHIGDVSEKNKEELLKLALTAREAKRTEHGQHQEAP